MQHVATLTIVAFPPSAAGCEPDPTAYALSYPSPRSWGLSTVYLDGASRLQDLLPYISCQTKYVLISQTLLGRLRLLSHYHDHRESSSERLFLYLTFFCIGAMSNDRENNKFRHISWQKCR